jgi:hypothetical protein
MVIDDLSQEAVQALCALAAAMERGGGAERLVQALSYRFDLRLDLSRPLLLITEKSHGRERRGSTANPLSVD